jgi:hypothetical protein
MTQHETDGAAKCPHCQEDVSDREPGTLRAAGEALLVCPNCDSILGGAVSDEVFVGLASLALAEDFEEVTDALAELDVTVRADPSADADDDALNHYAVTE